MTEHQYILKILPAATLILAALFFILIKIGSRFKSKAVAGQGRDSMQGSWSPGAPGRSGARRLKLECPALVENPHGSVKVTIKDLTFNGAFIACPNPFPIGAAFQVKIFIDHPDPLKFQAEVLWNNANVSKSDIIKRGMMVRFLKLTSAERNSLQDILSAFADDQSRSVTLDNSPKK
jgi:hypothetical protein